MAAGSALAVDRMQFSGCVVRELAGQPLIRIISREVTSLLPGYDVCIIAAGPLASDGLTEWIRQEYSAAALNFYDAIAPIIASDSIDMNIAFLASRNEAAGKGDYLNCPFTEEEYRRFHSALCEEDRVRARPFEEQRFFEACLPVEVLSGRGEMTLAFGPLKPIGLTDPRTGRRPFAVCQLRMENEAGTCYNMVGFQTRLTIAGQQRVFRMIPGLKDAEFLRYGSIHRNTYLDSPKLLAPDLSFKSRPSLFLAGQLCGSEGYTESVATGHLAALFACAHLDGTGIRPLPRTTAIGSLLGHVTTPNNAPFAPSNIHFGLFEPMPDNGKRIRKKANRDMLSARAVNDLKEWAKK
ncbi:MAG: methylenetetrahydrofolate--tRNA-(uracil(54)-C(5))-methyltransferase (FADH(2)-oxidizing) TrmFO [Chitinispirillaceae bacterium]|nr:methylenetetrahydrofolate--tRNA-(uracil(54)-C(5))-methyltransferase (FADH(2)-oxidizing) TrmFO [Chitinispirillaceae bacterium]